VPLLITLSIPRVLQQHAFPPPRPISRLSLTGHKNSDETTYVRDGCRCAACCFLHARVGHARWHSDVFRA